MSSTNRGAKRSENDYYPTPKWCVDALRSVLTVKPLDNFTEPCRGAARAIYDCFDDVKDRHWAELDEGVDYLNNFDMQGEADLIVTNPPFTLFTEFVEKAISRDLNKGGTVSMLLRVNALGSQARIAFWKKYQPTHVITLTPRPSFTSKGTDSCEYAWFCWDYGNRINASPFAVLDGEKFGAPTRNNLKKWRAEQKQMEKAA